MSAWTTPKTWNTGEPLTASDMNDQIRDNLGYTKERIDHWGEYIHIRDEKAQNTAGGTFTSGAWRTRDLNTIVSDPASLATLSSNQITLPAGSYFVRASAPAYRGQLHQLRLQNISDATTEIVGDSAVSYGSAGVQAHACLTGAFTLSAEKTLELQHQCSQTQATNGLGYPVNYTTEVYAVVEIWKVA